MLFSELGDINLEEIHILDVGSCNGLLAESVTKPYHVRSMDIAPANDHVHYADFTNITFADSTQIEPFHDFHPSGTRVKAIGRCSYDACCFLYLLSYMPDPDLRLQGERFTPFLTPFYCEIWRDMVPIL